MAGHNALAGAEEGPLPTSKKLAELYAVCGLVAVYSERSMY